MADSLPIPRPPRTPTPPPDDSSDLVNSSLHFLYDLNALHPETHLGPHFKDSTDVGGTRTSNSTPKTSSPISMDVPHSTMGDAESRPFNFKPTVLAKGPVVKSVRDTELLNGFQP
jgi:hypothetical protein